MCAARALILCHFGFQSEERGEYVLLVFFLRALFGDFRAAELISRAARREDEEATRDKAIPGTLREREREREREGRERERESA